MEFTRTFDKIGTLMNLKSMFGGGKENPVKNVMDNPENYKLEIYIEGDEIVMKVKKRKKTGGIKPSHPSLKPTNKALPPPKAR